jgi:hypothetical protein
MKSEGWSFSVDRDHSIIFAMIGNATLTFFLRIVIDEDRGTIRTKVTLEQNCPEPARRKLAVWCNAYNWQIKHGFFYCDQDDGEISFRDSMTVRHIAVTNLLVENLVKRVGPVVSGAYDEIIRIVASGK